ncbi:MAG: hypothetical protein ACKVS5_05085 [Parvularculaceae bacterium]
MSLKVSSIVGEALNFGARRFETIARVGWLPVSLLLVFNMAAAFLWLSLAYGEAISFSGVAASGARWGEVQLLAQQAASAGLAGNSVAAWSIEAAVLVINAVLVTSFMAPLIRYAGLGERPAPGLIRAPFGPDQLRFLAAGALSTVVFAIVVYAPIALATVSILGFIGEAMTTPYASFPDTDSLHTIELIFGADVLGVRWLYGWQVWGLGAAGLAIALFVMLLAHVQPRLADKKAGIGLLGRVLGVGAGVAAYYGAVAWGYAQFIGAAAGAAAAAESAVAVPAMTADGLSIVLFGAGAAALAAFVGLRVYPFAGVAVCRRSMALAGTLRVTRRFDLLRLALAFVLLGLVLFGAQLLLLFVAGQALGALTGLVVAAQSAARLGGGDDVAPLQAGIFFWAALGVGVSALWTLFTYGVMAGLMGRLYRESERP